MAFVTVEFFSESLKRNVEAKVIIPNDNEGAVEVADRRRLRTLVLLHGYCGNSSDWVWNSRITGLSGKYGLCVILPSGENSFYLDGEATGRQYATFVGEELPRYVQRVFHLSPKREDTFIGGFSMGGFGAIHTALQFPERFGGLFALSSALLQYELPNLDRKGNEVANYAYYELVFGNPAEMEHSPNNPEELLRRNLAAGSPQPSIYMACGTEDFLLGANRRFEAFLTRMGVMHFYQEGEGGHDFSYWNRHLEPAIEYLLKRPVTQALNPYLPSWEYIPDGEPYVFGDRVYVYGSHDRFRGSVFCLNDYVCWSAPVDNLGDWRYEGIIYRKTQDPLNMDGHMCLYAPDVTVGPDGRYYLYYVLDKVSVVSVAVCDTPAGAYQFYGYVRYLDGIRLGERPGDEPQFDPGVMTEGNRTYLYTGFCSRGDKNRRGAMCSVLDRDMLTVLEPPATVVPSDSYSQGSGFEGHEFFEASSIRKRGGLYYFIYSSIVMHELCYAVSEKPDSGFVYGGVIVSNRDIHIDSYKPAERPMAPGGNNHGSIVEIGGRWYIFYHRHTNGTSFSRQGCMEKIIFAEDGSIPQVEMTSCGGSRGPLAGSGEYSAAIACNLFCRDASCRDLPRITQEGRDGDEEEGYIENLQDGGGAGFKYFDCQGVKRVSVRVRGYGKGVFQVRLAWDGQALGGIPVDFANVWTEYSADISIPDGVHALYFTFAGQGNISFKGFGLEA